MRVVVFGGTGLIGSQASELLRESGHDVVALGRESGIDTTTGEGVAEAVVGADVVVDLTNSPSFADDDVMAFFHASTTHLLAAEAAAGVGHHVILSIVGADRAPDSGYLRAKVEQERLVEEGPVPFSIVRSTQFFEFIRGIADAATTDGVVRLTPHHLQPIASHDVVAAVVDVVTGTPLDGRVEIAGPEPIGLDELARRVLAADGDDRKTESDAAAPYFGEVITDATLTPTPGATVRLAPTTLDAWLAQQS